jgi:tetratricopeptide (TPR) repeat protein
MKRKDFCSSSANPQFHSPTGAQVCGDPAPPARTTRLWVRVSVAILASVLLWVSLISAPGADAVPAAAKADETNTQETLRAYLQLQEQLHATQLAVEQNRRESREAAAQNEAALTARLRGIEQALAAQRARELDAMQSSNRVMLIVAGSFAGVGFIAMLIMAYFQWRTVNGLAEISSILPVRHALAGGQPLALLGPGEGQGISPNMAEQSNARLLGALGQLEKRLFELEHTATANQPPPTPPKPAGTGSNGNGTSLTANAAPAPGPEPGMERDRINTLLAKGDSLLDRNEAEAALACFEEALALDPKQAEALVKKGAALEKLQKLEQAIACYDQAIALDDSMTIAYLHKGGLCNRLERFNDALECYEQALRTQEKRGSS